MRLRSASCLSAYCLARIGPAGGRPGAPRNPGARHRGRRDRRRVTGRHGHGHRAQSTPPRAPPQSSELRRGRLPPPDQGLATIGGLAPGRYAIKAEFSGFESGELKDVRLRAGDNKHVVALALTKIEETVMVGPRPAVGGRRSQRRLAHHAVDAGRDRGAVGRSQRARPAAAGHGRRQRRDQDRQLRRRRASAEGLHQVDPHRPRHVAGRKPFRRVRRGRDRDPGRRGRDPRRLSVAPARRRDERRESVRRCEGARSGRRTSRATWAARSCRRSSRSRRSSAAAGSTTRRWPPTRRWRASSRRCWAAGRTTAGTRRARSTGR